MAFQRPSRIRYGAVVLLAVAGIGGAVYFSSGSRKPTINATALWDLHQIQPGVSGANNPDGADGVFIDDVNGDGLPDVVSGHEQGLRVTLSINPGADEADVESAWPTVILPTVQMCSPEDAVIADVDQDGAKDIVAACETGTNRVEIMFAPSPPNSTGELLIASNWTRVQLTAAQQRSLRVIVADIAETSEPEIIVGGKESDPCGASSLGYYSSLTPRIGASWLYTPIVATGWVMDMELADIDGDSDIDIVYTDRERIDCPSLDGTKQGLRWLESDGNLIPGFTEHNIVNQEEHKWFTVVDADGDTDLDILDCRSGVTDSTTLYLNNGTGTSWSTSSIPYPVGVGKCQEITVADVDNDGDLDYGISYTQATNLIGVSWFRNPGAVQGSISGIIDVDSDIKFDNLVWSDVDGDGDLDAVTSEQHAPAGTGPGLGVVYYENPLIRFTPPVSSPVICTVLTSSSSTTDATSFATASITPVANRVVYAAVVSGTPVDPVQPTASGNSLTYTFVDQAQFVSNDRRLAIFRAQGASPTSGAITFDWAGQTQTSAAWTIIQCVGADTSGTNGSGATVQSTHNSAASATTITATLSAFGNVFDRNLCFTAVDITSSIQFDDEFDELSDVSIGSGSITLESQLASNQTTCTPLFSSSNAGIVAVEIKVAP